MKSIVGKIALAFLAPLMGKRLWMSLIGITILTAHVMMGINYLYSFQQEWQAKYFVTIWQWGDASIVAIVLWFIGVQSWGSGADRFSTVLEKLLK